MSAPVEASRISAEALRLLDLLPAPPPSSLTLVLPLLDDIVLLKFPVLVFL